MKGLVCLVILGAASWCIVHAQPASYTTDEFRSMLTAVGTTLSAAAAGERAALRVDVVGHADASWISAVLSSAMVTAEASGAAVASARTLRVTPVDVGTRYEQHEHGDSVRRILVVNVTAAIVDADGTQRALPVGELRRSAVLSRAQALSLQSKQYSCTWAELPSPATSFWQDILEPVVFVGAAVVTTVLFFTVRSQ